MYGTQSNSSWDISHERSSFKSFRVIFEEPIFETNVKTVHPKDVKSHKRKLFKSMNQEFKAFIVIRTSLQCSYVEENLSSQAPPTLQHNKTDNIVQVNTNKNE